MKLQTVSATSAAVRKQDEKGYTFVEVLIVVAVIAALAIGGFALYTGRGKTTEMTSMAQQVGQTVQSQQQLIYKGLRNGKVSSAEVAGSLNSLLAGHRFVDFGEVGPKCLHHARRHQERPGVRIERRGVRHIGRGR